MDRRVWTRLYHTRRHAAAGLPINATGPTLFARRLPTLLLGFAVACSPPACSGSQRTEPAPPPEVSAAAYVPPPAPAPVPAPLGVSADTRSVHRGGGHTLDGQAETAPEDLPYTEIVNPSRFVPGSLSLGNTSSGSLQREAVLPLDGEHHTVMRPCRGRGTNFSTEEVVDLLLTAAAEVATKFPDSTLALCNASKEGGGDIKWSKSHNSGRDVDIAFYVTKDGEPVTTPKLMHIGANLKSADGRYLFDVPRNWALVRALLSHPTTQVQWLFVSIPLKAALLEHARKIGEDPKIIEHAESVLWQPTDSTPHNDHFHMRIYCPRDDLVEGCEDTGIYWDWIDRYDGALAARVRSLSKGLTDPDPQMRLAVIGFLTRIPGRKSAPALARTSLFDPDLKVRTAALGAIRRWRSNEPAVIRGLGQLIRRPGGGVSGEDEVFTLHTGEGASEPSASDGRLHVVTVGPDPDRTAAIVRAAYATLGQIASPRSTPLLTKALRSKRKVGGVSEARYAAEALRFSTDLRAVGPLIEALGHADPQVRAAAAVSVTRLTNRGTKVRWGKRLSSKKLNSSVAIWRAWWAKHKHSSRDKLLLEGFRKASRKIKNLDSLSTVERLIPLTKRDDCVGYNSDRLLSHLTHRGSPRGRRPALRYKKWSRWWKKNKRRVRRNWRKR